MPTAPSSFPLRDLVAMLLAGRPGGQWRIREDDHWCQVKPADYPTRVQGWKLHISATWLSAPVVLHQVAQVLIEHGCAFKFAGTLDRVLELTDKSTERAQAGKVITVYPRDDDHLRTVAPVLDRATAGMPGPAVLSDRPYRAGSLVHYRYGAFSGVPVLNNDGSMEARLQAPDGTLIPDPRQPWFCPPTWTTPPYDGGPPVRDVSRPERPRPVLLNGRYRVDRAVSQSGRGGVYRATDQRTGDPVMVKQARAHISGLNYTGDARDTLRHEAAMLRELAGLAPELVDVFDQGPHLFLVVEELPGQVLTGWSRQWWQRPTPDVEDRQPAPAGRAQLSPAGSPPQDEGPPVDDLRVLIAQLADLVDAVHQRGLVYRDLTPNNVMVLPDRSLRLIDAELTTRPGEWVTNASTPGFTAPELRNAPLVGPAPGPEADCYGLGALLCFLLTSVPPAFLPDSPTESSTARTEQERITVLLQYAGVRNPAVRQVAAAVVGLTAEEPAERWTVGDVRAFLGGPVGADSASLVTVPGVQVRTDARLEPDRQQRLLDDGLATLASAALTDASERLIPTNDAWGVQSDPCNVQHGAAGVLAVLVHGSALTDDDRTREAVRRAAGWLDRRRTSASQLLPGLYFGRAGTAWALHAAACHLDDAPMAERALALLTALPVRWPNPDLTHGTAGVGMAHVRLWSDTKDPVLLERVSQAADHVLEQARYWDGWIYWETDPEFDSALAGTATVGFAHGVAGIGAFLLAAARATGRDDCRRAAEAAGETLIASAVREDGGAYWPDDVAGPRKTDMRYVWCNGASGVGTYLVRLWKATADPRYRQLAHEAAVMVRQRRWLTGVSACHGAAGNAEFLLDMANMVDHEYRAWAEELAACLYSRSTLRNGRLLVAETLDELVNLDFGTGLGGVVGFLLRLRHGGPRWFMVDNAGSGATPDAAGARE